MSQAFPVGAVGLVIAAILAASLSSIDSAINSCTSVVVSDFYNRLARGGRGRGVPDPRDERRQVYVSRVATCYMRDNLVPHVNRLVDIYRLKRDAMLKGLWEGLEGTDVEISKPEGGFFIWIKLPTGTETAKVREAAVKHGIQYTAGPAFFINGGGEEFIRLAYSWETPERNYEGAKLLAQAIKDAR